MSFVCNPPPPNIATIPWPESLDKPLFWSLSEVVNLFRKTKDKTFAKHFYVFDTSQNVGFSRTLALVSKAAKALIAVLKIKKNNIGGQVHALLSR